MRKAIGSLLLAVALGACSDSTGLDSDDIAGTWIASVWVFTNPANTSQTADIMALGGSFRLVLNADSTFTSTIQELADELPDVDTGTYEVVGSLITIAESGQGSPTEFQAVRNGDSMTLTTSEADFDWDDDGQDDLASMRLVLNRQ
jgi:hypothetical protein